MTGFRMWIRGGIVLSAFLAGTVALYAAHSDQIADEMSRNAPLHVKKALTLNVQ